MAITSNHPTGAAWPQTEQSRQPFHVLTKPIGPICNLDCEYCFYLRKEELYPAEKDWRMPLDVLENFIKQYIEAHPPGSEINVAFQGGEPTLMGVDFFRKAVEFGAKYRRSGDNLLYSMQTNGTKLDDEWCAMFKEHGFLIGLSVDGPAELHDKFRYDKGGKPSFDQVMRGLEFLKKHECDFNTLTVVQNHNADYPVEIYNFLKSTGSTFFQFIPIVEKADDGSVDPARSVRAEQFGRFNAAIFDEWTGQNDVGEIFVRDFDTTLAMVMGYPSPLCVNAETCGRAVALEHNGDLYSCDHFVNPEDELGNVMERTLAEMLDGMQQEKFGNDKRDTLPKFCRECEFLTYCNGGCPKDRLIQTPDDEDGLNYLCAGFKIFYAHTLPTFEKMAQCLRNHRPASEWREIDSILARKRAAASRPTRANAAMRPTRQNAAALAANNKRAPRRPDRAPAPDGKVGRNDPCPCGSGRKFKKCCGA